MWTLLCYKHPFITKGGKKILTRLLNFISCVTTTKKINDWWMFSFLFIGISRVLLGNQYLHKTANGDIQLFDAATGTSSVILSNTTLVCWLIFNICRLGEGIKFNILFYTFLWNQCLICSLCTLLTGQVQSNHSYIVPWPKVCSSAVQLYKGTNRLQFSENETGKWRFGNNWARRWSWK